MSKAFSDLLKHIDKLLHTQKERVITKKKDLRSEVTINERKEGK